MPYKLCWQRSSPLSSKFNRIKTSWCRKETFRKRQAKWLPLFLREPTSSQAWVWVIKNRLSLCNGSFRSSHRRADQRLSSVSSNFQGESCPLCSPSHAYWSRGHLYWCRKYHTSHWDGYETRILVQEVVSKTQTLHFSASTRCQTTSLPQTTLRCATSNCAVTCVP